jgi:hypothetical protein
MGSNLKQKRQQQYKHIRQRYNTIKKSRIHSIL